MSCTLSAESYLQNCRQELKTNKKTVAKEVSGCFGHTMSIYIPLVLTKKGKKEEKEKRRKRKKGEKKKERTRQAE